MTNVSGLILLTWTREVADKDGLEGFLRAWNIVPLCLQACLNSPRKMPVHGRRSTTAILKSGIRWRKIDAQRPVCQIVVDCAKNSLVQPTAPTLRAQVLSVPEIGRAHV